MTAPHDTFRDCYEDYRDALRQAMPVGGKAWQAAEATGDQFDAAWDRASRALPPLTTLGQVALAPGRGAFLLHAIARQAVWPEESLEPADDKLALASAPAPWGQMA